MGNGKKYQLVIVGGGLAGSTLAWELKKIGFMGRVLLIEKKLGSQGAYGYRNIHPQFVSRYGFEVVSTYQGLRDGLRVGNKVTWCDMTHTFQFIHYEKACRKLVEESEVETISDFCQNLNLQNKTIQVGNDFISFEYLIDATGNAMWSRRQLHLPLPQWFYVGLTWKIPLDTIYKMPTQIEKSWFIYYSEDTGYMEDYYIVDNHLCIGIWDYSVSVKKQLGFKSTGLLDQFTFARPLLLEEGIPVVIVAEPKFPLVYGPIAYLGDSGGMATPASSEGTTPIFEGAQALAHILKSDLPLTQYQSNFLKKNGSKYAFHKAFKEDLTAFNKIFMEIREYPEVYRKLILNQFTLIPMQALLGNWRYWVRTILRTFQLSKQFRHESQLQP